MRAHALLAAAIAAALPLRGVEAEEAPAQGRAAPARACSTTAECARAGRGHVCEAGRCTEYRDRRDAYDVVGLRKSAPAEPEPLVPLVAAVPAFGYSPSSGLLLGVAGTVGLLLGEAGDTTMSSATGSLMLTTKKQLIANVSATTMTAGNRWELLSEFRFLLYNQATYGLGTGPTPIGSGVSLNGFGALAAVEGAQDMDFDLVRFYQSVLRRVGRSLFLGGGYRLDRYTNVVDRRLDLTAAPPVVTSHYAYSRIEGFDPAAYTVSGVSLEASLDSRDSVIAPYRGWLAHLRLVGYPTWLGSTKDGALLSAEGRAYVGLSDEVPRNVLAFWALASGVVGGTLPYLALPASGWDPKSTSGRGYVQGRFRGTAMVYAEAEWRFRLGASGLLGGTVFASAQTFSRPDVSLPDLDFSAEGERLFEHVKPAGGVGLRVMLMKQSRTALRVDVAGGDRSVAFYLGAGEAF